LKYPHRRSSSVPLPDHRYNGIALPALPFLTSSRSGSPIDEVTMARMMMGQRRASSAQPFPTRSWTMPGPSTLARDDSPLPDPDMSLFDPSFLDGASNFGFHMAPAPSEPFVSRIHLATVFLILIYPIRALETSCPTSHRPTTSACLL
jgi:transcription factor SOX7/8/10/18 (SOX group E/F)